MLHKLPFSSSRNIPVLFSKILPTRLFSLTLFPPGGEDDKNDLPPPWLWSRGGGKLRWSHVVGKVPALLKTRVLHRNTWVIYGYISAGMQSTKREGKNTIFSASQVFGKMI